MCMIEITYRNSFGIQSRHISTETLINKSWRHRLSLSVIFVINLRPSRVCFLNKLFFLFLGSAAQSAFFVGSIIGGLIFGYIADHYGRIPALVSCNAVGFFASIATAFCNSFWSFCVARMIVGSSFDNCFNVLFIIGTYRHDRVKNYEGLKSIFLSK